MSEQNKRRITNVLNYLANGGSAAKSQNNHSGIVTSAIQVGVVTKRDFARAVGCEERHLFSKVSDIKLDPFRKVLRDLGFGD